MSFEIHVSTSPPALRPPPLLRVEEPRPFDAMALGLRAPPPRPSTGAAPSAAPWWLPRRAVAPTAGHRPDEERRGLLADERRRELLWPARDASLSSSITLLSAVILWLMVCVVVFLMYYQMSDSISKIRSASQPYMSDAINHTMSILKHTDESAVGASDVVAGAQAVTDRAVPASPPCSTRRAP